EACSEGETGKEGKHSNRDKREGNGISFLGSMYPSLPIYGHSGRCDSRKLYEGCDDRLRCRWSDGISNRSRGHYPTGMSRYGLPELLKSRKAIIAVNSQRMTDGLF